MPIQTQPRSHNLCVEVLARDQLGKGISWLLAVSLPAGVGLALAIPQAVAILYRESYHDPVTLLAPWLVAASILSGVKAYYIDFAFQLAKRTDLLLRASLVCTVTCLGLSFLLIPRFRNLGPAIAMATALGLSTVYGFFLARRVFPVLFPAAEFGRIGVATLIMACAVLVTPGHRGVLHLVAEVVVGAVAYAGAAAILNILGIRTNLVVRLRRMVLTETY